MDASQGKEDSLVTGPTPLTHGEFYKPTVSHEVELPFVAPGKIPIHPSVWRSKFAYSEKFVDEVIKRLPQAIKEDLQTARKITGKDYGVEVLDWGKEGWVVQDRSVRKGMGRGITSSDLKARWFVNPKKSYLRQRSGTDQEIILDPTGQYAAFIFENDFERACSDERLREYNCGSEAEPRALTWYSHNLYDATTEHILILRNYALLVNNIGLEWVAQGKI
jgi:hypothetical protein